MYEDDHPDRTQEYLAKLAMQIASIMNSKADQLKLEQFFITNEFKISKEAAQQFMEDSEEEGPVDSSKIELTMEQKISQNLWRSHRKRAERVFAKQKQQRTN